MIEQTRPHHGPPHRFVPYATYFVTASTNRDQHLFKESLRRAYLESELLEALTIHGWQTLAWAVFPNHYHFVAVAPEDARSLVRVVRRVHSRTAIRVNKLDGTSGRTVWQNYRDTCLDREESVYWRLCYVHFNPVRHGMADNPEEYPFCSAARRADEIPVHQRYLVRFSCDGLAFRQGD